MPNKDLINRFFKISDEVYNKINQAVNQINPESEHAKGVKRAKEILEKKSISYAQMKRLKNYFDNYQGDGSDDEFKLVGGEVTKMWVDKTLGQNRESIKRVKTAKKEGGMENAFLEKHEKDRDNADPTNPNGGLVNISKGSKMRNIMANDTIYKSSEKNESYLKEIETIKYLIEYMNKK